MPEATDVLSHFAMPSKVKMMSPGTRFGALTVVEAAVPFTRANGRKVAASICECECGSRRAYRNIGLRNGYWKSCGCQRVRNAAESRKTHGHAVGGRRSRELSTHKGMISRCHDPKNSHFADYGGRGIFVCIRWRDSFEGFLADMGPKPEGMTLDRIDNSRGYEPGNCRWAPAEVQANNKRTTRLVLFHGEELSLAQFARSIGIKSARVRYLLETGASPDEIALIGEHQ